MGCRPESAHPPVELGLMAESCQADFHAFARNPLQGWLSSMPAALQQTTGWYARSSDLGQEGSRLPSAPARTHRVKSLLQWRDVPAPERVVDVRAVCIRPAFHLPGIEEVGNPPPAWSEGSSVSLVPRPEPTGAGSGTKPDFDSSTSLAHAPAEVPLRKPR